MYRIRITASIFALALCVGVGCGDGSGDSFATKTGSGTGGSGGAGGTGGNGMGADCTPGFYKNHVPLWDHMDGNCGENNGEIHRNCGPNPELERACCLEVECTAQTLANLQGPAGRANREMAKAFLDDCFGDMAPCEDERDGDHH